MIESSAVTRSRAHLDVERWSMGGCGAFAIAMHRLWGLELAAVAVTYRGRTAVSHVFCIDDRGRAWDARSPDLGERDADDMVREADMPQARLVRLGGEADVLRMSTDGPDGEPLLRVSRHAVDDAVEQCATAFRGLFGRPRPWSGLDMEEALPMANLDDPWPDGLEIPHAPPRP